MQTEHEAALYKELLSFPLFLTELLAIRDDAVGVMLASPVLSYQNCINRGTKSLGGSRVERVVVRVLASDYVRNLEESVAACRTLYDESDPPDQLLLLSFWRGEDVEQPFPPRLLYRYQYLRDEVFGAKVSTA